MKRIPILLLLLVLALLPVFGSDTVSNQHIRDGLTLLKAGDYENAAVEFRRTLDSPEMESFYPEALYWLIKADIAIGLYNEAAASAYIYISRYPSHGKLEEVEYQGARLLFLEGESAKAIVALGDFIERYPESEFLPSALYWIGESLMELGRLEEADAIYADLLYKYPGSVKREAARYRRSEISLLYRERELLDLLKWSHEEYLQDAEDFFRRESEYRSVLTANGEDGNETTDSMFQARARMLGAKERLLILQRYYVEQLLELNDEI